MNDSFGNVNGSLGTRPAGGREFPSGSVARAVPAPTPPTAPPTPTGPLDSANSGGGGTQNPDDAKKLIAAPGQPLGVNSTGTGNGNPDDHKPKQRPLLA